MQAFAGGFAAILAAGLAVSPLSAQGHVPEPIKARVNQLVAQCAQAGGQLGNMTGQGQFVIPRDFTGDGRTDFVVSEGNFPCAGRPNLFRPDGLSRVELWVADGAGGATLAFHDRLMAYRILAGPPAKLQIARKGAACGGAARCGDELRWDASARRFSQVATDGRDATPRPVGPALASAAAPAAGSAAPPGAVTLAGSAGPAPPALPVSAEAEGRFKADCRRQILADDPKNARWVDGHCTEMWGRVVAAGPAADALLGVLPAKPGLSLAEAKARMTGVRWGQPQPNQLATGALGALSAALTGRGAPTDAQLGWMKQGEQIPFDIPAALEARGAKLTLVSCEKLGAGEGGKVWAGSAPGRAPFTLSTYQREAPTANAFSSYSATVGLVGKTPPRGDISNCRSI